MIHQATPSTRVERITHRMLEKNAQALEVVYSDSPYNDARVERRLTLTLNNGMLTATRGTGRTIDNLEEVLETAYQNIISVTPRTVRA